MVLTYFPTLLMVIIYSHCDPNSHVITGLAKVVGYTEASLTLGSNGLFYGATSQGGTNGFGNIFSFDPRTGAVVPEPSPVLGLIALGLGAALKRRRLSK